MVNPVRRRLAGALALTAASVLLAACGAGSSDSGEGSAALVAADSTGLSGVVLKVGDQVKNKQSLLQSAGELDNLPYKIEWASFTSGPPLIEALNAGAIDVGGTGDSPAVFAQAAGAKVRVVAASRTKSSNDFILVHKGSSISDVKGLTGHSVAVAKGSSSHGLLVAALREAGVDVAAVDIRFLAPPDAQSAFATGKVDAWAVWNPYAQIAQTQADGVVLRDGKGLSSGQGFDLASQKALADPKKAAAIKDFLARSARATAWAVQHPAEWVPIYARNTGLPTSIAEATFATSRAAYVPIDDEVIRRQQGLIDTFVAAKVLPGAQTAGDFFDTRYNDVIAKEAK